MSIRIAIAEDHPYALKEVIKKLQDVDDFQIKITALDGKELIDALKEDAVIDVILMDIQMPVMDGIATTSEVKRLYPHIRVVMLTTFDDDDKIFEAIVAGAHGYLLKDESRIKIESAIRETIQGGAAMSPSIALKVLNLVRRPIDPTIITENFNLTKREIELLEQLKMGRSYEQVGQNLFISVGTVQKHISNIYHKLQVNNKVEAVQKATQHRLI
jgi:DNA-binding NarL/FixJ family response regulator